MDWVYLITKHAQNFLYSLKCYLGAIDGFRDDRETWHNRAITVGKQDNNREYDKHRGSTDYLVKILGLLGGFLLYSGQPKSFSNVKFC